MRRLNWAQRITFFNLSLFLVMQVCMSLQMRAHTRRMECRIERRNCSPDTLDRIGDWSANFVLRTLPNAIAAKSRDTK
jgi:hypothetical protein